MTVRVFAWSTNGGGRVSSGAIRPERLRLADEAVTSTYVPGDDDAEREHEALHDLMGHVRDALLKLPAGSIWVPVLTRWLRSLRAFVRPVRR